MYLISYIIILLNNKTFKKANISFLLYLPIIDSLHNMLPGTGIGGHYIAPIILIFIYLSGYSSFYLPSKKYMIIFFIVLIASIFFSSDFILSSNKVLGFISAIICYPMYFFLFHKLDESQKKIFFRNIIISLTLFAIYISFSTFLKWGLHPSEYASSSYKYAFIYLGRLGFYSLHSFSVMLVMLIIIYKYKNGNISLLLLYSIVLIILFLILKRSYFFVPLIGGFIAFLTVDRKIVATILFMVSISLLLNNNYLFDTFLNLRNVNLDTSYLEENRFLEFINYKYEIIDMYPMKNILFGTEIFNSEGKFFWKLGIIDDRGDRILHSDYTHILYGAGIIGFLLYLSFLVIIIRDYFFLKVKSKNIFIFASIYSIIIIMGFFDGGLYYSNRIFHFAFLGFILADISTTKFKEVNNERE